MISRCLLIQENAMGVYVEEMQAEYSVATYLDDLGEAQDFKDKSANLSSWSVSILRVLLD